MQQEAAPRAGCCSALEALPIDVLHQVVALGRSLALFQVSRAMFDAMRRTCVMARMLSDVYGPGTALQRVCRLSEVQVRSDATVATARELVAELVDRFDAARENDAALVAAAGSGCVALVHDIARAAPDLVAASSRAGSRALLCAIGSDRVAVVEALLRLGVGADADHAFEALDANNLPMLRLLTRHDRAMYRTAIRVAAYSFQLDVVDEVVSWMRGDDRDLLPSVQIWLGDVLMHALAGWDAVPRPGAGAGSGSKGCHCAHVVELLQHAWPDDVDVRRGALQHAEASDDREFAALFRALWSL